ncbi:MAG: YybH family protein [Candidatus Poribacteria bacterium]
MKEFIKRTAGEIEKAWGNPKYRYLIISALLFFVILVLLIGVSASIKPNPDGFYQKWRELVENPKHLAPQKLASEYDKLWDKKAKVEYESEFKKGVAILGKDARVKPAEFKKRHLRKDSDENSYNIRNIQITVNEQTGGQREYNCSLTLKPKGVTKNLKIVAYRQEEIERKIEPIPKFTKKEEVVTQSRSTSLDTELRIRQVLGAWLEAWEQKDLERYMNRYADYAEIIRVTVVDGKESKRVKLTKNQLRNRMKRLFKIYDEIRVDIEEQSLKIDETQLYAEANVEFLQEFTGIGDKGRRRYRDYGLKHLKFINDPTGGWKIYHENWTMYPGVLVNK